MVRYADFWQLMKQFAQRVELPCDARGDTATPCQGWNELSDKELPGFWRRLHDDGNAR